jgi:hypothetical protein
MKTRFSYGVSCQALQKSRDVRTVLLATSDFTPATNPFTRDRKLSIHGAFTLLCACVRCMSDNKVTRDRVPIGALAGFPATTSIPLAFSGRTSLASEESSNAGFPTNLANGIPKPVRTTRRLNAHTFGLVQSALNGSTRSRSRSHARYLQPWSVFSTKTMTRISGFIEILNRCQTSTNILNWSRCSMRIANCGLSIN